MLVVVIDEAGRNRAVGDAMTLPPIGSQIDMCYAPTPRVKELVLWSCEGVTEKLGLAGHRVEPGTEEK